MKPAQCVLDEMSQAQLSSYYTAVGELRLLAEKIAAWRAGKGFHTGWLNVPEKLMLIVTELSEAMEAYRHLPEEVLGAPANGKNLGAYIHDERLGATATQVADFFPYWENFGEELADALIRLLDLAASLELDIEGLVSDKMAKNHMRPKKHGKEC